MKNEDRKGCGGKGSCFKPPHHVFFKASCVKHDDGYDKGGDWFDRFICDLYFLRHMIADSWRYSKIKFPYFFIWSILYYIAVRIFGRKYFNYK